MTALVLWRRAAARTVAVGWLWYLGMLVPVIGLVQVGHAGPRRPLHLPARHRARRRRRLAARRLGRRVAPRRAVAAGAAIVVARALAVATVAPGGAVEGHAHALPHALRAGGESVMVLNGLATAFEADSEQAEAAGYLRRAVELAPDYANAHVNLGVTLARRATRRARPGTSAAPRSWPRARRRVPRSRPRRARARGSRRGRGLLPPRARAAPDDARAAGPARHRHAARRATSPTGSPCSRARAARADPPAAPRDRRWRCSRSRATTRSPPTQLRQAARDTPDEPEALNALAWLLATSPDSPVRDGAAAGRPRRGPRRSPGGRDPNVLDTQAAARAAAGRIAEAADVARAAR